ncbi:MAG: DUF4259 domain-containing protein [Thermoleophilia bacterium]|jgi:hypothetical protein|nr:DUF4259 domain-containing protein [Thermoleophilia bacterium]
MGDWGTGPFTSEGGGEWAAALRETGDLALLVEDALDLPEGEDDVLDAEDAQRAVAAAAAVAALRDGDRTGVPDGLLPAPEDSGPPAEDVVEQARAALARVVGQVPDAAWRAVVERLTARLAPR